MTNVNYQSKRMAWVPIILTAVFIAFYAFSQSMFIECCPAPNADGTVNDKDCKVIKSEEAAKCQSKAGCKGVNPSLVFSGLQDPFDRPPDWTTKGPEQELVKGQEILAKRYSGRFTWMFFSSATVLFSLAAIGVFLLVVARWRNRLTAGIMGGIALVIGVVLVVADNMPIAGPLFCRTIASGVGGMTNFIFVNQVINGIGYTASVAMVLAIFAVLGCETPRRAAAKPRKAKETADYIDEFDFARPKDETPPEPKPSRKEVLLEQMGHLKGILYVSTVLLIVGVLRLNAGFTWSLSFMTQDTVKIAEGFLSNVTTVLGGFFTILLACTYLPSVYILWKRAEGEDMAEMEKKGFKFSFAESLPKILAIAAPLLTGPIAELLKNLAPK